ncbi:Hypothetical protein, putative [Bodo saltans]|uniref:Uncharacterized protein n=1 Tax=Bodo saltans TaxID=75058 RepID=A0A0S4IQC8_BODSA|nr:Hypothetical protein, putative [Bodo saltans]|eukprot:CUF16223.1 Hypothetical protein, putative [Bodo saltans]
MSFTRPSPQRDSSAVPPPPRHAQNTRAPAGPPRSTSSSSRTPSTHNNNAPQQSPQPARQPLSGGGPSRAASERASAVAVRGAMDAWLAQRDVKVTSSTQRLQAQDRRLDEEARQQQQRPPQQQHRELPYAQLLRPNVKSDFSDHLRYAATVEDVIHGEGRQQQQLQHDNNNTPLLASSPQQQLLGRLSDDSARFHTPQSQQRVRTTTNTTAATTSQSVFTVTKTTQSTASSLLGRHNPVAAATAGSSPTASTSSRIHDQQSSPAAHSASSSAAVASTAQLQQRAAGGRAANATGIPVTIDEVARRKKHYHQQQHSGSAPQQRSDPARVLLHVFAPLGLLHEQCEGDASSSSSNSAAAGSASEAIVTWLEMWLTSAQRGGSGHRHATSNTHNNDDDDAAFEADRTLRTSVQLERTLWTTLHRTIFYCIHVLTPSSTSSAGSREDDRVMVPLPLSLKQTTTTTENDGSTGSSSSPHRGGGSSSRHPSSVRGLPTEGAKVHSSSPAMTSTTTTGLEPKPLTPRAWFFVCFSLVEMGYPRHQILRCLPNTKSTTTTAPPLHKKLADEEDVDEAQDQIDGVVNELLLVLLWLARRYQLAGVAELVQLREHAPFLFEDGAQLVVRSETVSATTNTAVPPPPLSMSMVYPVGEGWGPWCTEDVEWLGESYRQRSATVSARVARCQQEIKSAAAAAAGAPHESSSIVDDDDDDEHKDYEVDDGRSSRLAAWKSSRHVLQLHQQLQNSFQQIEGLLLRRAELMDALGSSHSLQDFMLCARAQSTPGSEGDLYAKTCSGLEWWREVPKRCAQHLSALSGFMSILVSLERTRRGHHHRTGFHPDEREDEGVLEEDKALLVAARRDLEQHYRKKNAAVMQRTGPHHHQRAPAGEAPKLTSVVLEAHVFPEDQPYVPTETLPTRRAGSVSGGSPPPAATQKNLHHHTDSDDGGGVLTDDLLDLLQRYHATDAHEFFESKRKWLTASLGLNSSSSHLVAAMTPHHHGTATATTSSSAAREMIRSVVQSVDGRYSLASALRAELHHQWQSRCQEEVGGVTSEEDVKERDVDDDDAPLAPRFNYNVLHECHVSMPSSFASRVASVPAQSVYVGPPASGRTTSARVEIHRLQKLLDEQVILLSEVATSLSGVGGTTAGATTSTTTTTTTTVPAGQAIVPRVRRPISSSTSSTSVTPTSNTPAAL